MAYAAKAVAAQMAERHGGTDGSNDENDLIINQSIRPQDVAAGIQAYLRRAPLDDRVTLRLILRSLLDDECVRQNGEFTEEAGK
jgi:hypothetical protein